MKIHYVIEGVINPGSFWSSSYQCFRGYVFATKYKSELGAKSEIENYPILEPCKITKLYSNEN